MIAHNVKGFIDYISKNDFFLNEQVVADFDVQKNEILIVTYDKAKEEFIYNMDRLPNDIDRDVLNLIERGAYYQVTKNIYRLIMMDYIYIFKIDEGERYKIVYGYLVPQNVENRITIAERQLDMLMQCKKRICDEQHIKT